MDVLGILRDYNIRFERKQDGRYEVLCPFHRDENPSGVIDSSSGYYKCWSCNTNTNIYGFLSKHLGKPKKTIYFEVNSKFAKTDNTPTQSKDIERFHNRICR